ncbi:glycerol-3-phosphate ABC transporter substrate-binding protein [Microcoleus sp. CAWBG58]|uniref:glycerol-3-phosphate ABC transporter substrate-binding protein n=1 Tax=Microcoleus sp. CAWBG58 TaxID=2841651 RepID=UPI0025F2C067|nr:glycerol-3-phosphate ABC transporter substrate-binding protein [Microcoleus sp. CAWBG58]
MLTSYKPDVFDSLDHFFTARDLLEQAQDNMTELGAIIRSHGLQKQVGICLLHKHFDLSDNERLVEEFDGNNAYVKPTADYGDAIPYMWKVEQNQASGELVWFPLEFVRVTEAVSAAVERSAAVVNNSEFLHEIAGKLSELGMTGMFGISILHRDAIKVAEGEILVESTDDEARVLTLSSVPRQNVDRTTLTQTLWQFPNAEGFEVGAMCSHCTHCTHCTH